MAGLWTTGSLLGAPSSAPVKPQAAELSSVPPARGPSPLAAPLALDLRLPTDNDGLLTGQPEKFFMGVDRTTEGKTELVWQGGQYGFVRNPLKLGEETVYTRFHEGVDIAPTLRDNTGEPLDLVCAISNGRVVFTHTRPSGSNYGNYVVIEHDWGYGPMYSLSGHLMRVDVTPGQFVEKGAVIGRMGHTGSGLDRRRSHLHLELNFLINERFEAWHEKMDPAHQSAHTPYHGYNLVGVDIAALYQALAARPATTIPGFVSTQTPYFKALAPNTHGVPDMLQRYPWLWPVAHQSRMEIKCASWAISFSAAGLPLKIEPSTEVVPYPTVVGVVPFHGKHTWKTMGRVAGTGSAAQLTPKGTTYVNLITGAF